jgi:hypothetical protein
VKPEYQFEICVNLGVLFGDGYEIIDGECVDLSIRLKVE